MTYMMNYDNNILFIIDLLYINCRMDLNRVLEIQFQNKVLTKYAIANVKYDFITYINMIYLRNLYDMRL